MRISEYVNVWMDIKNGKDVCIFAISIDKNTRALVEYELYEDKTYTHYVISLIERYRYKSKEDEDSLKLFEELADRTLQECRRPLKTMWVIYREDMNGRKTLSRSVYPRNRETSYSSQGQR